MFSRCAFMQASVLSPAAHDITDVVGVRRRCIPRHLNFVLDRARPRRDSTARHDPSSSHRRTLVFRRDRPAVHDGLTAPLNRSKLTSRGARPRLIAAFVLPAPICGLRCDQPAPHCSPPRSNVADSKLTKNLLSGGSSCCRCFVSVACLVCALDVVVLSINLRTSCLPCFSINLI